ncbi:MAG: hypothetical protein AUH68_00165 [Gemmatimonadetes bacterium 13_1_40CM_4_69_5]|nr:MAG: hypothetical protein AUH68_00165 [Gemmatimonadetes bacterium 13_1_40CM_4_69_5]
MLEAYLAGRVKAEQVVVEVASRYYGAGGRGQGAGLRPIVEVIERAAPGVVELAGAPNRPGFLITAAERPFPREYETQLRVAVEVVLREGGAPAQGGFLSRVLAAIRGVFR